MPDTIPMANGVSSAITLNWRLAASWVGPFLVNRYTAFFLGVFVYSLIINLVGGLGGVTVLKEDGTIAFRKEYLELTFVFYLYCYFNMILRPSRWQAWLAAMPLFLAYLGQDIYYLMYSNVFRVSELAMVPELLHVLTPWMLLLLAVTVAAPLTFFLWSINFRRLWLVLGRRPAAGGAHLCRRVSSAAVYRQLPQGRAGDTVLVGCGQRREQRPVHDGHVP